MVNHDYVKQGKTLVVRVSNKYWWEFKGIKYCFLWASVERVKSRPGYPSLEQSAVCCCLAPDCPTVFTLSSPQRHGVSGPHHAAPQAGLAHTVQAACTIDTGREGRKKKTKTKKFGGSGGVNPTVESSTHYFLYTHSRMDQVEHCHDPNHGQDPPHCDLRGRPVGHQSWWLLRFVSNKGCLVPDYQV